MEQSGKTQRFPKEEKRPTHHTITQSDNILVHYHQIIFLSIQ